MYEFKQSTILHHPVDQVFDFFSKAENLERITPPLLKFRIITPTPIQIDKGTLIDYRLKIHGIPINWRTRISAWDPPYRFIDEQLKGPYQKWIHEHTFESIENGTATLMKDHVRYSIFAGPLIHPFVRKDILKIFNYRTSIIETVFPSREPVSGQI